MKLHREGYQLIISFFLALVLLNLTIWQISLSNMITIIFSVVSVFFWGFIIWFFRVPSRELPTEDPDAILSPADGIIVTIEETDETEYFHDRRLQISIFMSPLNMHQNTFPVSGQVIYTKYHPGKYLVAWLPKSSELNERSTIVIKDKKGREILMRQIAGAVARRIKTYCKKGDNVIGGNEMGFIKFGSRVDIFLPLDTKINVEIGQLSVAMKTILANL